MICGPMVRGSGTPPLRPSIGHVVGVQPAVRPVGELGSRSAAQNGVAGWLVAGTIFTSVQSVAGGRPVAPGGMVTPSQSTVPVVPGVVGKFLEAATYNCRLSA